MLLCTPGICCLLIAFEVLPCFLGTWIFLWTHGSKLMERVAIWLQEPRMKGGKAGGKNYGGFFKGGGFPTSSPATERRKTIPCKCSSVVTSVSSDWAYCMCFLHMTRFAGKGKGKWSFASVLFHSVHGEATSQRVAASKIELVETSLACKSTNRGLIVFQESLDMPCALSYKKQHLLA